MLSSSVVNNPRVPRVIRHSLNLESGLNDGLALPAVLAFVGGARVADSDFVWWKFVLQDVRLGLAFGVAHRATSPRACCRAAAVSRVDAGPPASRSTRSASPS